MGTLIIFFFCKIQVVLMAFLSKLFYRQLELTAAEEALDKDFWNRPHLSEMHPSFYHLETRLLDN